MDLTQRIQALQAQGIEIPAPATVDIREDVSLENIRGPHTILHPGTRLRGSRLVISPGCSIGAEGPATVENCVLDRHVQLGGGYFSGSVFLEGSSMGLGAHVRAGCLIEEQANGAHTVGLKQTILLPFVTLGSLINFCDVLMAGGTSRDDHSEVGSSFIHFNFTPFGRRGDKATASLVGDVPHGVMLHSPRIFLGGQAGLVGPVQIDFGTVLAAGFVYRRDHGPNELVVGESIATTTRPFVAARYRGLRNRVDRNLRYIGNLVALWHWYDRVRLPRTGSDLLLRSVYQAARGVLEQGIEERLKQLGRVASYMDDSAAELAADPQHDPAELTAQRAFGSRWPTIETRLRNYREHPDRDPQLRRFEKGLAQHCSTSHLDAIRQLDDAARAAGTAWLTSLVDRTCAVANLLD